MVRPRGREHAEPGVSIYQRFDKNGKKTWLPVEIPQRKPTTGGLYLKDDKHGDFYISWYEGTRKRFKKVKVPRLSSAIAAVEAKAWELVHPERVKEEIPDDERLTIAGGVYRYLEQMAGNNLTVKEHRHALEEFQKWNISTFVEQVSYLHQRRCAGGKYQISAHSRSARL
jgi:hypothetical protein